MKQQYKLTSIFALTFILFFILFSTALSQNVVYNKTDINGLTEYVTEGLNILDIAGIHIAIVPINKLEKYKDKTDVAGLMQVENINNDFNLYRIYVRQNRFIDEIEKTVAHELIHVLQHYEGRLESHGKDTIFDEKVYNNSYPYMMRPWENEAFNNSTKLKNQINDNLN